LGTTTASVTFSSISGSYTDLILIYDVTQDATAGIQAQVNGDTGSNYSYTQLYGTGASALSNRGSSQTTMAIGYSDSTTVRSIGQVQFMNYSNATTNKTVVSRTSSNFLAGAQVNLWRNTAAITSITLLLAAPANFLTGSTFTLYGIKAA
jgi:hypothetical protein